MKTSCISIEELFAIAVSAHELEAMMYSCSGTTADWPLSITTDDEEFAEQLTAKLQALRLALAPYRDATSLP